MFKLLLLIAATAGIVFSATAQSNDDLIGQWKVVKTATARISTMTDEETLRFEGTVLITITPTVFDCPFNQYYFEYDAKGSSTIPDDERDYFHQICLALQCDKEKWKETWLGADHDAIDFWLNEKGQMIFVWDGVYFLLEKTS